MAKRVGRKLSSNVDTALSKIKFSDEKFVAQMYQHDAESGHSFSIAFVIRFHWSSINIGGNSEIKLVLQEVQTKMKLDYK